MPKGFSQMSQPDNQSLGYFGKLPSHGDFISRYLPNKFISPWDLWLQETMVACKHSFQGDWIANYMTMPVYHFALSSGICGETVWTGILMPSRDYSGRLFPFTMATPLSSSQTLATHVPLTHNNWLEKLQNIALTTLTRDFTQERLTGSFDQAIRQLQYSCPQISEDPNELTMGMIPTQVQDKFAWHADLDGSQAVYGYANALNELLRDNAHAYSVWWTSSRSDLMFTQGLPTPEMMPALFDNDWERWGWKQNMHDILNSRNVDLTPDNDHTITL